VKLIIARRGERRGGRPSVAIETAHVLQGLDRHGNRNPVCARFRASVFVGVPGGGVAGTFVDAFLIAFFSTDSCRQCHPAVQLFENYTLLGHFRSLCWLGFM